MRLLTLFAALILIILAGCNKNSKNKAATYTDFERATYYHYLNKKDSAFLMYSRYVNNADDTMKKGMAYRYMGDIQLSMGDIYGAQESATRVLQTLDTIDKKHYGELGYAYNLLGDVSLNMKRYDEAVEMYNRAIYFLKGSAFMPEVMNGKATTLQKKGTYTAAIAVYDSILALNLTSQSLVARAIDNKARTKWLQDSTVTVLPEFWRALKIRLDSQYKTGLNASYAHLSDYYVKPNPDSALWYAQKMLEQASQNQSPDDILEALDKLIRLNNAADLKHQLYSQFKALNDSLQLSRDTTRSRFALIRYDVEKSKANNLVLQQDFTRQKILLYSFIVIAIMVITGLRLWYVNRKNNIKQESENAIHNSRLKTSQKVHDVVANGLYGIINELEHTTALEREPLLDKIESLYEKSRNISYEDDAVNSVVHYDTAIPRLLTSFASKQTNVIMIGNGQTFWNNITPVQKQELYLVFNELMVNMKKHSQAKNVVFYFKQEQQEVTVHYKDDGIGFAAGQKFGNGLNNTVNRIKTLNGNVTFEKSENGGVSIMLRFPLQSNPT